MKIFLFFHVPGCSGMFHVPGFIDAMSCIVKFHVVRSALQYSACRILYVYIFIFADQVFTDPTFFGIFVCGPLQFFVVNVCAK